MLLLFILSYLLIGCGVFVNLLLVNIDGFTESKLYSKTSITILSLLWPLTLLVLLGTGIGLMVSVVIELFSY